MTGIGQGSIWARKEDSDGRARNKDEGGRRQKREIGDINKDGRHRRDASERGVVKEWVIEEGLGAGKVDQERVSVNK